MWRFDPPLVAAPPGAQMFLDAVAAFERRRIGGEWFDTNRPVIVARAPGRLDLMGGIADYSGSLVLEWPLACATWVAVQWCDTSLFTIASANADVVGEDDAIALGMEELHAESGDVRDMFGARPGTRWAAYAAGAVTILARDRGVELLSGMRVLVWSDVPVGKGVSSSAALEVAAMHAICGLLGVDIDGRSLALLCQRVENEVAGAPCGVMDQITSACGRAGELVALLCQPAELETPVRLPESLAVFGIDSGIRHEVRGADYANVRIGTFIGHRIVADLAGLRCENTSAGRVAIDDPRWRGYLANLSVDEWTGFESRVPESLRGRDFLSRYGGITDAVTRVDLDRLYAVRAPAAHPVHEHARVCKFRDLLEEWGTASSSDADGERLGELMYASHASYSSCGLGSAGTDRIVELVRSTDASSGLLGAKITGGGSGGTVAVLARRGAESSVRRVADEYARESGRTASFIAGTSDGASVFGARRIVKIS